MKGHRFWCRGLLGRGRGPLSKATSAENVEGIVEDEDPLQSRLGDFFDQSSVKDPSDQTDVPPPSAAFSQVPKLCDRCLSIDFENFSGKIEYRDDDLVNNKIMDLDTVEALAASVCPLCRLFASIAAPKRSDDCPPTCQLEANYVASYFGIWPKYEPPKNTILLSVRRLHDQSLAEERERLFLRWPNQDDTQFAVRSLLREFFDESFVSSCLNYCENNHGNGCNLQDTKLLKGLQVIDCETRTIVTAPPDCQYVALSYVWGQPTTTEDTKVLNSCPKTISDTIAVTLKLKLKYLWIDRYCINQSDKADKLSQISQMDLIYAKAYICVIAAAGDGPHYGLPGVNGTLRSQQPSLLVGQYILTSGLKPPKRLLQGSKWATRGWTYQEGLLAKRRLVFTDEQVFFECNVLHCSESWILPLNEMHEEDKTGLKYRVQNWGHHRHQSAFQSKLPDSKPWDIMIYVSEYRRRQLTYAEDRVNAMKGIFHAFEGGEYALHHFIGVPILPSVKWDKSNNNHQPLQRSPEECFLIGLSWYHTAPGKRHSHFPSWSWAGWDGQLSTNFLFESDWTSRLQESNVCIEKDNTTRISLPEKAGKLPEFLQSFSPNDSFIHIETRMCICEPTPRSTVEKLFSQSTPKGRFLHMPIGKNRYGEVLVTHGQFYPDTDDEESLTRQKLHVLFLGDDQIDFHHETKFLGIVVVEKEGCSERVGVISFSPRFYRSLGKYGAVDYSDTFMSWWRQLPKNRIRLG